METCDDPIAKEKEDETEKLIAKALAEVMEWTTYDVKVLDDIANKEEAEMKEKEENVEEDKKSKKETVTIENDGKRKKEEDTEDIKEAQKENEVATNNRMKSLNNESKECIIQQNSKTKYVTTRNMQACMECKVSYESDKKFLSLKDFLASKYFL